MRLTISNTPKVRAGAPKRGNFTGWVKCSGCGEMLHQSELKENLQCCPKCDFHGKLSVHERLALLADEGSFSELFEGVEPHDRLSFVDTESYAQRLKNAQGKTGQKDAIIVGSCRLGGHRIALGVFNFAFMGGSMGSVVGEKLTLLMEYALSEKIPLIIVSASGGARMQESIFSLMQMAKTSFALARLHEAKIPYISVLTDPTSGGVTASFAALGDLILAEPGALICFAGPRVVEQTMGQKLPAGAQRAEFLLKAGMIDGIVRRADLKKRLTTFIEYLT